MDMGAGVGTGLWRRFCLNKGDMQRGWRTCNPGFKSREQKSESKDLAIRRGKYGLGNLNLVSIEMDYALASLNTGIMTNKKEKTEVLHECNSLSTACSLFPSSSVNAIPDRSWDD